MALLSLEAWGMLLMAMNGAMNTAYVVSEEVLRGARWPYFRINAISCSLSCLCLLAGNALAGAPLPERREAQWLLLRGVVGAATFLMAIMSVHAGASPGDAAALSNINIVVAALLGSALLDEHLRWMHGAAVGCSLIGAVLITQPEFLFGSPARATPWLGYALALASGCTHACIFIAARKLTESSLWLINLAPTPFCAVAFAVLPLTPLVEEPGASTLARAPQLTLALVLGFVLLALATTAANSAAGAWCPAAVSATVQSSSKLVTGYAAQMLLLQSMPNGACVAGAGLMLLAVLLMELARRRRRRRQAADACALRNPSEVAEKTSHARLQGRAEEQGKEGLASCFPAEVAECGAHSASAGQGRPSASKQTVSALRAAAASP